MEFGLVDNVLTAIVLVGIKGLENELDRLETVAMEFVNYAADHASSNHDDDDDE